jgi:hypothetical protein
MTIKLAAFVFLFLFAVQVMAQTDDEPPPPRPTNNKPAPALPASATPRSASHTIPPELLDGNGNYIEKMMDVTDEGKGFKVTFVGKAEKEVRLLDLGWGKVEQTTYSAENPYGIFSLNCLIFPVPINDPREIQLRYDDVKAGILRRGDVLLENKEVNIGGFTGREFVSELPNPGSINTRITLRVVIVEKRAFQLSVITNLYDGEKTISGNKLKHLNDFFDSFIITEGVPAKTVATVFSH